MTNNDPLRNGQTADQVRLDIENIGGISRADVTFSDGVTLVSGANASNKSSFLRSLAGILGGPVPPLKTDAETGSVRLHLEETEYSLELTRRNGETVVADSNPYAGEGDLCELFVSLTESNPIRRAVVTGDELSEYLLKPVDTEAIEAEIQRLRTERNELDDRLEELDAMANRLPGLETRRESLESDLADTEASLRAVREEVQQLEADAETATDDVAADLQEKRAERNEIRDRIRTQETAIESLKQELEEVDDRLDALGSVDADTTIEAVADELEELHQQKQQLTSTINALSPIVDMNARLLNEDAELPDAIKPDDVVSELDPSTRSLTCWTCGSTVEQPQIADQLETIRELLQERRNQRDALTERIQVLTEQKRELETQHDERSQLRDRREQITDELERRRDTLETLEEDRHALEVEIERLQRTQSSSEESDRLSECYDQISDLEYERGQLTSDLEALESEIDTIETALSERDDIEAQRESVATALQSERDRIDTIERDIVETFNEMMQQVLEALSYRFIERVWLERRSTGDTPSETAFELHIVRQSEDGTAYEDTIETLSKSEREVIGLVVALAGYLVHDVATAIPFIAIDAVEMFDAARIQSLVELFADHTEYVVATVLPAETDEMDGTYEQIWTDTFTDGR
jgi:DNA repair exonuclease SbcCD ATPase subunit